MITSRTAVALHAVIIQLFIILLPTNAVSGEERCVTTLKRAV